VLLTLEGTAPQPAIRIEHKNAEIDANPRPPIEDFPERVLFSIKRYPFFEMRTTPLSAATNNETNAR